MSSSPSKEVVSLCPGNKQIHIILDNLSAHKTTAVREFLEKIRGFTSTSRPHTRPG